MAKIKVGAGAREKTNGRTPQEIKAAKKFAERVGIKFDEEKETIKHEQKE